MRAAGIDVHGEDARALALQVEREVAPPLLQQLVGEAMGDEGVEALEVEQRLDVARARRIAVAHGGEVGAERAAELRAGGEHLPEGLRDQAGVDVGMVEALRQAVAHGVLEAVLAEDGGVDEAGQRRLGAHRLLGLAPQLRPDGIDRRDVGDLGRLRCTSHAYLRVAGARVRFQGRHRRRPSAEPANRACR